MISLLNEKVAGHYKLAAQLLNTSEWGAEQILNGGGSTDLKSLENLFNYFGIGCVDLNKKIKYELSVDVNQKIFKNYSAYWLQKKKFEIRESTYANYTNLLINLIIPCLGNIPCEKFDNKVLQMFAFWCKENGGKNQKGVSEHYIKDALLLVKAIIRDGQEENVFPDFVFKQIKVPKTLKLENKKQVYTKVEYEKIISYILENISSKSVGILLGIFTGMRIGEICALQFKDVDFEENVVHVYKTIQRIYNPLNDLEPSKIIITPCKTQNSIRDIPLTKEIVDILNTMKIDNDFYILSNSKKPIEPRTYRKFYDKFMKKCGIEPIKFHALRHTFASLNIENGTDVETIKDILGHSDVTTTLKIYTHTTKKAKEKAIDKFNSLFKNQKEKINFTSKYKGNICCINKKTSKLDFIGSVKEISSYLSCKSGYVCDVINGIEDDSTYNIIPQIIGITHDENGNYVGG